LKGKGMKILVAQFMAILGLGAAVFAPSAQAAGPVSDFFYSHVCPTMDNTPGLITLRWLLVTDARLLGAQDSWDTVTGAIHEQCPQYEGLIGMYLDFYGPVV